MQPIRDQEQFRRLVHNELDQLPPQQQAIANHLLDHLEEAPLLSIPELARAVGASEATIVRFAQRLGFSGFAEMKMVLVDLLRDRLTGEPTPKPTAENDTLAAVGELETGNIRRAVDRIDRDQFRAAAAALFKADHIFTFGMGISAHLADLATYMATEIGLRASTLSTRFSNPREPLVVLRPTDLLFSVSLPPYSRVTIDILREAGERGIPTLALVDRPSAPATQAARHHLAVPSHNMLFTNALGGLTTVLNGLFTEVAVRHQGEALKAVSSINRILSEDEDLIHETK